MSLNRAAKSHARNRRTNLGQTFYSHVHLFHKFLLLYLVRSSLYAEVLYGSQPEIG